MNKKQLIEMIEKMPEEEYNITVENEPIINDFEFVNGEGIQTYKNQIIITLTQISEETAKYVVKGGIKVFEKEKENE